ncbi:MAG: NAD(P)-dependent oxidoreductase [Burkholderiales bacterium]
MQSGGIVNQADIAAALKLGHLSGVGIDPWVDEPLPLDAPLLAI